MLFYNSCFLDFNNYLDVDFQFSILQFNDGIFVQSFYVLIQIACSGFRWLLFKLVVNHFGWITLAVYKRR